MSPARRRDAVRFLVKRRRVSKRRACQVVGQHRSTQRYRKLAPEYELRLVEAMNELAARHPRWGYWRVWTLLRSEGWRVNRKRIGAPLALGRPPGAPETLDRLRQTRTGHGGEGDLEPARDEA